VYEGSEFNIEAYYESLDVKEREELGSRADSLARISQYEVPFQLTLKYANRGSHVLDWGCGNGFFSYFLVRHGFDVVGYGFEDHCPPIIDGSKKFKYVRGDLDEPVKLPFENHCFDYVFSVGVLEHVHQIRTKPEKGDQLKSVEEVYRILKPGGFFLIFNLPNKYSWTILKQNSRIKHDKRFNKEEIHKLMSEGEFTIEAIGRYGGLPRNSTSRVNLFKKKQYREPIIS
jgi:SAM-dependent methyltransferase